jgi:lipopolysaccharide biosynthesis glycosyltransferase
MSNNLIYTLVNFNTKEYLAMFRIFIQSLILFSKPKYELLIITDAPSKKIIENFEELKYIKKHHFLLTPTDKNLYNALLHKCDIGSFKFFNNYDKIMYLDCDIILQNDINKLFDIKIKNNILYAPKEGTLDGKYWTLNLYNKKDFENLTKLGFHSFNSGTMLFKPSEKMKEHFENVKNLALKYNGSHFYDQSFLNYYFNINKLSNTEYISKYIILFPDVNKYYPEKTIVHFAGIGRYKEKAKIMKNYLNLIITVKKI